MTFLLLALLVVATAIAGAATWRARARFHDGYTLGHQVGERDAQARVADVEDRFERQLQRSEDARQAAEQRAGELRAQVNALEEEKVAGAIGAQVGQRVVYHQEDRSIAGVLVNVYDDGVVLRHPEWIRGDQRDPLGGEIVLPRDRLTLLQVLAGDEV